MKHILITGGAGFVGSHLAIAIKKKFKDVQVTAFDNLKRRGSELNIERLQKNSVSFFHGDIRNSEDFNFLKSKVSLIVECSAEPSVLAGYQESPQYVINTNLIGCVNCLELARRHNAGMIFLSTSRVYSIEKLRNVNFKESLRRFELTQEQPFAGVTTKGISEGFPTSGWRSLYGATKLASELLIEEFVYAYGLKAIINRCGVIAGPWQMGKVDQGVFTYWLLRHAYKKNLEYIGFEGSGKQVRDLLHIDDLCRLINFQIEHVGRLSGRTYNVGGGKENSLSLLETTEICRRLTGHAIAVKKNRSQRVADIPIYISDNTHVFEDTGWKPKIRSSETLKDIYHWIKSHKDILKGTIL